MYTVLKLNFQFPILAGELGVMSCGTMNRELLLRRAILNCIDFARQYVYYLAISEHRAILNDNILIYINNNFIDMAVLEWCHCFNSYNDPIHYRKVTSEPEKFKSGMLEKLGLNEEEWAEYRESVKNYRDKGVAHLEPVPRIDIPDLNLAYSSMLYYYEYFIGEFKALSGNSVYYESLDKYCENRFKKYRELTKLICQSIKT